MGLLASTNEEIRCICSLLKQIKHSVADDTQSDADGRYQAGKALHSDTSSREVMGKNDAQNGIANGPGDQG